MAGKLVSVMLEVVSIAGGSDGVYRNKVYLIIKLLNAQQVGLIIGTSSTEWGNLMVYNNTVEGATEIDLITEIWFSFGYGLFLTSSAGEFRPDNVTCFNNSFSERESAIAIYRSYEDKSGSNYLFNNNMITNSSNGFNLYGTSILYQNFYSNDNQLSVTEQPYLLTILMGFTCSIIISNQRLEYPF